MPFDLIVRGGTLYDGTGGEPVRADIAVAGDLIWRIGDLESETASNVIDATGFAVAPGFINILSHSYFSIMHDSRSLGELMQGVTTQLIGEGSSMGPLSPSMKEEMSVAKGKLDFEIEWTRLSEYLALLEKRGTSQNFGSLIGAATLRVHAVGYDDRPASAVELDQMRALVDEEMADGAFGIGSALIYPPGAYAPTSELIEICKVAARRGGKYFSHLRSEGEALVEGVEELLQISSEAEIPTELWHLKAIGKSNWPKMDHVIEMVEKARQDGMSITADIYPYVAGATGLIATIPPWVHDGGRAKLVERLKDSGVRERVRAEIQTSLDGWENMYQGCGSAENILVLSIAREDLRRYQGMSVAAISDDRGTDPIETIFDLIVECEGRIGAAYFSIDEDNLRKQIRQPWVSVGSDAASMSPEGVFLETQTHPRSYGAFARFLAKYVRDEGLISLTEGVRRMTSLPASVLGLDRRGRLEQDFFADIVVFDPEKIQDHATFQNPHQLATGVKDVVVNGVHTLRDGQFAGRLGGRALRGGTADQSLSIGAPNKGTK